MATARLPVKCRGEPPDEIELVPAFSRELRLRRALEPVVTLGPSY